MRPGKELLNRRPQLRPDIRILQIGLDGGDVSGVRGISERVRSRARFTASLCNALLALLWLNLECPVEPGILIYELLKDGQQSIGIVIVGLHHKTDLCAPSVSRMHIPAK